MMRAGVYRGSGRVVAEDVPVPQISRIDELLSAWQHAEFAEPT